ncbi:MAG: large conductance mechanosensitive channel, partial [Pseudohongiellaceae bacterium]
EIIKPENAVMYGKWVNSIINLIIVGLVLFMIVKAYNKTKTPPKPKAPAGPSELDILKEIRDSLKK